jgi:hypothetical protein
LHGYILEGTLGNIATSKLTNTRELTGGIMQRRAIIFIQRSCREKKINKKAYRFDGIAGYVR